MSEKNENMKVVEKDTKVDAAQQIETNAYVPTYKVKPEFKQAVLHAIGDRPFNEMMLGLESWLPIYMTGQVSLPIHTISDNLLLRILFPPLLSKVQKFNKKFLYCSFIFIKTLFYIE